MDGASSNRSFMAMHFKDDPMLDQYMISDMFNSSRKLVLAQDIKHVQKKIRNNLFASRNENKNQMGKCLILEGKPVVWDHWIAAFKFNESQQWKLHRKLTKEHIELTPTLKMRNHLASQVLNRDMLFLMKAYQQSIEDNEALQSTVLLLEHTAKLVDIFENKSQPIRDMNDARVATLNEIQEFFSRVGKIREFPERSRRLQLKESLYLAHHRDS